MKIKYWPQTQGVELNMQVSELFRKLYLKFNYNLYNETSSILSIDILNAQTKREIFKIILLELEILVLDIIEADLNINDLQRLNKKMLIDLINKSTVNFYIGRLNSQHIAIQQQFFVPHTTNKVLCEHELLLQYLLNYLVFGSYIQESNSCGFIMPQIPVKHIEILLDNIVIQVAHIMFSEVIQSKQSVSNLLNFLISEKVCNNKYLSIRSIATFRNNLFWFEYIDFYIRHPKMIYNNRYEVWLFSNKGLQSQYIYANREKDLKSLCTTQIILVTLLELQDFIIPKFKSVILYFGTLNLNIFHNLITYSLTSILQSFVFITRYFKK